MIIGIREKQSCPISCIFHPAAKDSFFLIEKKPFVITATFYHFFCINHQQRTMNSIDINGFFTLKISFWIF